MSNLRDHSQPCEHEDAHISHQIPGKYHLEEAGFWGCSIVSCPGGREVTIDQIGWFDPGSQRFCYTDEKEYDDKHLGHKRREFYTESVFAVAAIGDTG